MLLSGQYELSLEIKDHNDQLSTQSEYDTTIGIDISKIRVLSDPIILCCVSTMNEYPRQPVITVNSSRA